MVKLTAEGKDKMAKLLINSTVVYLEDSLASYMREGCSMPTAREFIDYIKESAALFTNQKGKEISK